MQRRVPVPIEMRIQHVQAEGPIWLAGECNRIDPGRWRPVIMGFQELYGLWPRLHESTLARVPESMYRSLDIDRTRVATGDWFAMENV